MTPHGPSATCVVMDSIPSSTPHSGTTSLGKRQKDVLKTLSSARVSSVLKRFHRFYFKLKHFRFSSSRHHLLGFIFIVICIIVLLFWKINKSITVFDEGSAREHHRLLGFSRHDRVTQELLSHRIHNHQDEDSVNLWRKFDKNCPPETNPPDPALYGTGAERCYVIGLPDGSDRKPEKGEAAPFWQMNSRALCYSEKPICLFGSRMDNFLSFEPRGSSSCYVLSVQKDKAFDARILGMNESCAAFRAHYVSNMYGREIFNDFDDWHANALEHFEHHRSPHRHAIRWRSDFAIVVPKYAWSNNICHYNRMWAYVIWVIRNLRLFVSDAESIKHLHILFRIGYQYNEIWHVGMRDATLEAVKQETGINITISQLRFDHNSDFQCVKRGIWLGKEGRVDAFPFFNDSDVWLPRQQIDDSHWPVIPHEALWLRQVVSNWSGLPDVGNFSGPHVGTFHSIPVPPRRVAILQRSPRSSRRVTPNGRIWLESIIKDLCERYDMKLEHVRVTGATPFKKQVSIMRRYGVSIGIHGANILNTMFQPAGGALFELFPWRYVRYYYAAGSNSGLRYSYHEPAKGKAWNCTFGTTMCAFQYRESPIFLTENDRWVIQTRIERALAYVVALHRQYPNGIIPLHKNGNVYYFGDPEQD